MLLKCNFTSTKTIKSFKLNSVVKHHHHISIVKKNELKKMMMESRAESRIWTACKFSDVGHWRYRIILCLMWEKNKMCRLCLWTGRQFGWMYYIVWRMHSNIWIWFENGFSLLTLNCRETYDSYFSSSFTVSMSPFFISLWKGYKNNFLHYHWTTRFFIEYKKRLLLCAEHSVWGKVGDEQRGR